jgi:hypothetical protein
MNHINIRHAKQAARVVIAVCSTLFASVLFAPSAFARISHLDGGAPVVAPPQPHPTVVHSIVAGGMAGWQITLIAVGAALLAATGAVLMDRTRAARRGPTVSAA